MNMNIEEQLYNITRRKTYINIDDQLFDKISKPVFNRVSDDTWTQVEIPVGDVVWSQLYDNIASTLYDYEY